MDYQTFCCEVKTSVEQRLNGRSACLEVGKVVKANDCVKDSMLLIEEGRPASPTIYLNDFYEWYESGVSLEEITEQILELYDRAELHETEAFLNFLDFEKARDHITFKLLNTAVNRKYLEDAAHLDYLDLSLVFYCTVITGGRQHVYSSKISRELLDSWGIREQTLYPLARLNTERMLGVYLKEIRDVFLETAGLSGWRDEEELLESLYNEDRSPMYVLSNRPRNSGAGTMMLEGVVSRLAHQLQDDLFIIPSSIHEVLLLPANGTVLREDIEGMVREINRSVLLPADILSDHTYLYSREDDRILM